MDKFMFSAGYAVWDDRVYQKGRKKGSRIAYIGGCSMTDVLTEISEAYEKEHEHVNLSLVLILREH